MKIFLIGFMGVGKSTLGSMLASKLNLPFRDLDEEIVASAGMSIPDIFSKFSEDHFRALERTTLHQCIQEQEYMVLSTGGGLPCFYDNLEVLNQKGLCIYLRATALELSARLAPKISARPVLAGHEDDLLDFISSLLDVRKAHYEKARLIVDVELAMDPAHNVSKIMEAINHYQPPANAIPPFEGLEPAE